jgi:hypothetical protein
LIWAMWGVRIYDKRAMLSDRACAGHISNVANLSVGLLLIVAIKSLGTHLAAKVGHCSECWDRSLKKKLTFTYVKQGVELTLTCSKKRPLHMLLGFHR